MGARAARRERSCADVDRAGPGFGEEIHGEKIRGEEARCEEARRQEARGEPAVVLVPATVRAALARLVRHSVPSLSVLSYTEVPEDKRLKLVGTIN